MKIVTLLFALGIAGVHTAQADDMIQWYVGNFPPATIPSGPEQGKGWGDQRIQLVMKRVSTFQYEITQSSTTRMMEDMKTKPNVCNPNLLKTPEREAFIEFSQPFSLIIPNGIVTTRTRYDKFKPYLTKNGELRLDDLLAHGQHRIGLINNRSYGAGIDAVIKKYAGTKTVVDIPSLNYPVSRLLKLAHHEDYDLVPGHAPELRYLARESGLNESDFIFLTVAEESALVPTYIGCSKSDIGKKFIAAINKFAADEQVQKEDTGAYRSWLDDKTASNYDALRKKRNTANK